MSIDFDYIHKKLNEDLRSCPNSLEDSDRELKKIKRKERKKRKKERKIIAKGIAKERRKEKRKKGAMLRQQLRAEIFCSYNDEDNFSLFKKYEEKLKKEGFHLSKKEIGKMQKFAPRFKEFELRICLYFKQKGRCNLCNRPIPIYLVDLFDFDHIIPKSKGGSDNYSNIQLLCHNCNSSKSNHSMERAKVRVNARMDILYKKIRKYLKNDENVILNEVLKVMLKTIVEKKTLNHLIIKATKKIDFKEVL